MFGNSKFRCFLLASLPFAVLSASLATIFLHESPQPWIFGRYSLPYFIFSLLATVSIIFILFIYFRFKRKAFFIYGGLVVGFCSFIFFVEVAGQVYAALRPSYRVLSYVPEKTLVVPTILELTCGGPRARLISRQASGVTSRFFLQVSAQFCLWVEHHQRV